MKKIFKKYTSIENHYREKFIQKIFNDFPGLDEVMWVAQEKIDGSNFSIITQGSTDEYICGKRSSILQPEESFFNWQKVVKKYESHIARIRKFLEETYENKNVSIHIFGELYGSGIQNRINYGPDKYIKIYDLKVNGDFVPPKMLQFIAKNTNTEDFIVPFIHIGKLKDLLELDISDDIEGWVLKPFEAIYVDQHNSPVYIKRKTEAFSEKMKTKVSKKVELENAVIQAQEAFASLLNENRVLSYFSKEGVINEPQQLGGYIKNITRDAWIDMEKDYEDLIKDLSESQIGKVKKIGGKYLVPILNKHL